MDEFPTTAPTTPADALLEVQGTTPAPVDTIAPFPGLFLQAPIMVAVLRGPAHIIELANHPLCAVWGHTLSESRGRPLLQVMPELRDQVFPALLDGAYRTGTPYVGVETRATFTRGGGKLHSHYFNFVYSPFRGEEGLVEGIFVIASDVTRHVEAGKNDDGGPVQPARLAARGKDAFLAALGRELRNPASPIVTALRLMERPGLGGSAPACPVAERQADQLTRLVVALCESTRSLVTPVSPLPGTTSE